MKKRDSFFFVGALGVVMTFLACSSKSSTHEREPADSGAQGGTRGSPDSSATGGGGGATGGGSGGSAGTSGASAAAGSGGGSTGASGSGGGGSSGASGSATDSGGGSGPTQDAGRCAGSSGPTMVGVLSPTGQAFCIDSTEVTKAQYQAFLTAKGSDVTGQDAWCSWNTTYVPSSGWPPTADQNHPVSYVDWCDAFAFCKWAGKRLCGRIGGGANGFSNHADPAQSEWQCACSGGGARPFPYGSAYDGSKCVGADYDGAPGYQASTDVARPAGTSTCEGGYPGIFDLSGNVWEWEDSCDASTGRNDSCRVRGGSFRQLDPATELTCAGVATSNAAPRSSVASWGGFRCCS